jgi:hypothetical protein
MPVLEYDHMTILIGSYVYLATPANNDNRWLLVSAVLSLVMIDASLFIGRNSYILVRPFTSKILVTLGLFICWSAAAWKLRSDGQRASALG